MLLNIYRQTRRNAHLHVDKPKCENVIMQCIFVDLFLLKMILVRSKITFVLQRSCFAEFTRT